MYVQVHEHLEHRTRARWQAQQDFKQVLNFCNHSGLTACRRSIEMRNAMTYTLTLFAAVLAMSCLPPVAMAQKPSAYPAKGQDAERQTLDDAQCQTWAKQDTGIDPAAVAATPPPATGPQGERVAGAARGAAAGVVIGDSSKSARTGATVGVLAGGHQARKKQAAQAQQAQTAQAQSLDTYYRAYGACMQSRGYTVK
jgi:hypothetical protein